MRKSPYRRTVLPSGLRVVSEQAKEVKSVSVAVWLQVGSRNETPQNNGLSHLIEHMTFKGTRKRNARQIVYEFESRGGTVNAFTSREQTCYYAKVLDTHLASAFEVLADIVQNSLFDVKELSREQNIVLEEIKDVRDTPSDWVHDQFAQVHWGRRSLGLPVLGLKSTVLRSKRPDLVDYRRAHYRPERMVIAACGNVGHEQLVEYAAALFDRPARGRAAHPNGEVPTRRGGHRIFPRASAQTHLVLGFPSLSYVDERKYALLVLQQLFGGGMSSRLFQTVRERLGLAYSVYSFQDSYRDCGVFGLYIGTDKKSAARALSASTRELGRLKEGDLGTEEVAAAKEQLKGHMVLGLESTTSRMNRLARHEIYTQGYLPLPATLKHIDKVSRDDVVELARDLVDGNRITSVGTGPLPEDFYREFDWSHLA